MAYYFKSNESVDENHVVTSAEAPVQGLPEGVADILKKASVVALVEDYMRCSMKHHKFQNSEEMIAAAKAICDAALNGGDMTSEDAEHVISWCQAHRLGDDESAHFIEKFCKHVIAEEAHELVIGPETLPEDIRRAMEIKQQCEQMGKDMAAKYGAIITGYAQDFIRLYGKLMDEHFTAKFNA